jgi:hypothetical protein
MYQKIPIHYPWMNGILVFFKLTPNICFPSLFNYKAPIAICHVFLDALKIFSIESYHVCLNITKVGKIFSKYMHKGLSHFYVYGYWKIVLNLSKILIQYSHVVWLVQFMYEYFFTHDKSRATYKKLTPSLHLLPLFNYNQLLFATSFFDTLRMC